MQKLKQLIVPITVPLDDNGKLIEKDLEEQIEYLGKRPLFVNGEMGEQNRLSQAQRKQVIIFIQGKHDGPLLLGVSGNYWYKTIDLLKFSRDIKAEGVVLRPGSILHITTDQLEDAVSKAYDISGKPVYLYHNSAKDSHILSPENVKQLSDYQNLAGIKVTADMEETVRFLEQDYREGFKVYIGNPNVFIKLDTKYRPAVGGAVIGTANVLPESWDNILKAYYETGRSCVESEQMCWKDITAIDEFNRLQRTHGLTTLGAVKNYLLAAGIYSSTNFMRSEDYRGEAQQFRDALMKSFIAPRK